jgi:hypothetical protein
MPKHKQINVEKERQLNHETRLTINLLKSSYLVVQM